MDEGDDVAARPSIMEYNGGLLTGPPGLSPHRPDEDAPAGPERPEYWIRRGLHPPIVCPDPRIIYHWTEKARCPYCGLKARLAGEETTREWAYRVTDTFWWKIGTALAYPFRRAQADHDGGEL
jgi:hypothetical protein